MKYEKVIAERMKERSLANLKQGGNFPSRPNEPLGEKSSKRKELAKIAGTSEGNGVTFRYTTPRPCILTVGAFSIFQSSAVRVRRILRNLGVCH